MFVTSRTSYAAVVAVRGVEGGPVLKRRQLFFFFFFFWCFALHDFHRRLHAAHAPGMGKSRAAAPTRRPAGAARTPDRGGGALAMAGRGREASVSCEPP